MELTLNRDYSIFNMYKLVSVPNRNLIRWLLIHNCVGCSEIHYNIMKLFCHLYDQIPILCNSFSYVLNSLVTCYLKSCLKSVDKSSKFSRKHNFTEIFLHNVGKMGFIHTTGIEIPFEIIHTKSDIVEITQNTENCDRKGNVSADSDFYSFLLPLKQDYTKSSKGYSSLTTSIHMVKDKNTYSVLKENKYLQIDNVVSYNEIITIIPEECEVICKQVQKEGFFQNSNTLTGTCNESKSSYEVLDSDVISCLQDFNSCAQQKSLQKSCFRNKNSKISFNHSLKAFPDQINEQLNCDTKSKKFYTLNSDSDDSVIFSENYLVKDEKCDMKIELHNSVNYCFDSDGDDGIVFSGNVDDGQESEFVNEFDDTSSDYLDIWDDDFDENDPDLLEAFNIDLKKRDFSMLSCSQNKMHDNPQSSYGYVNACFEEDDDYDNDLFGFNPIISINQNWNNTMKDVSSEPRTAKKVSFVPLPDLVSVEMFEPDNDGYCYSLSVFDQIRFRNRIQEFEPIMEPYLTSEHRGKVYSQNNRCEKYL